MQEGRSKACEAPARIPSWHPHAACNGLAAALVHYSSIRHSIYHASGPAEGRLGPGGRLGS